MTNFYYLLFEDFQFNQKQNVLMIAFITSRQLGNTLFH